MFALCKAAQALQPCKNSNSYMHATLLIFLQILIKFHDIVNLLCQFINNLSNNSDFLTAIMLSTHQQVYITEMKTAVYVVVQHELHKKLISMINVALLHLQKDHMQNWLLENLLDVICTVVNAVASTSS